MPDFIPHGQKGMSIWKGNGIMVKFGVVFFESRKISYVLFFSQA
jgi:hypothetical protein